MATNFLIGRGELLTSLVDPPLRQPGTPEVYTFEEASETLIPRFEATANNFDAADTQTMPADLAVARMVINPTFVAKSYFPKAILRMAGLEAVGSRTTRVVPRKWGRKGEPEETTTTELFVAGPRAAFRSLPDWIQKVDVKDPIAVDLTRLEDFGPVSPQSKIKALGKLNRATYEVGLHLPAGKVGIIQKEFIAYGSKVGAETVHDLGIIVGRLWFLPVRASEQQIRALSEFSMVRVIRPMPKLRSFRPMTAPTSVPVRCELPTAQPLSSTPRVAILDGGLPDHHPISPWVPSYVEMDQDADDHEHGPSHGLAVSSAFLFGPIQPNTTAGRPYSYVDHYRVFDQQSAEENDTELYRTHGMIEQILLSRQYEFVNLSLGPFSVVDDGDPHPWTAMIDEVVSDGKTFVAVAAGNNGEFESDSDLNRVLVPGDAVNVVTVGSADINGDHWNRASYSAIGPGRSPGVIKPDLLAFGGSSGQYFHALAPGRRPTLTPQLGTSFAAPYLLRSAVAIRAIMGDDLSVLAIRALLVHSASHGEHSQIDVGWGKIPEDVMDIITCGDGVARIIYQGELKPGKYLRAPLPMPSSGLQGMVNLKATFCFATHTDPHHSGSYTRSGLEVVFRPHGKKVDEGKTRARTRSFFSLGKYATEASRRSDSGKWETVLHDEDRIRGSGLKDAVFDIHYAARSGTGADPRAEKIAYALVVTIEAPKHPNLFSSIVSQYSKTLVALTPEISLPITV